MALASAGGERERLALTALIRRCRAGESLPAAAGLLADRSPTVRASAAELLVEAASWGGLTVSGAASRDAALVAAAEEYGVHRNDAVLTAFIKRLDARACGRAVRGGEDPLSRFLRDSGQPAHLAMRKILRRSADPALRDASLLLLALDSFAGAALARLGQREAASGVTLERAHLAENPARRRRLSLMASRSAGRETPPPVLPAPEDLPRLTAHAKRHLPRLMAAAGAGGATRRRVLRAVLADGDAGARLTAAAAAPPGLIDDFCFDADGRVAAAALRRWSNAGRAAERADDHASSLVALLVHHSVPAVRRLAEQEARRLDPWDASRAEGRLCARRLLAADRDGFVRRVGERLRGDAGPAVLALVRALAITADLEAQLLELAADARACDPSHERVAATLAALLGDLPGPGADAALERLVHAAAGRVRANAIEAMARRARRRAGIDARVGAALLEAKGDSHHRVRSSAALALLREVREDGPWQVNAPLVRAGAIETVREMLLDTRAAHRAAGEWAAARAVALGTARPAGSGLARAA